MNGSAPQKLDAKKIEKLKISEIESDEAAFFFEMNSSKMATDLVCGVRKFKEDGECMIK